MCKFGLAWISFGSTAPRELSSKKKISVARVDDRLYDIVILHLLDRWEMGLAQQISKRRVVIRDDVTLDYLRMPMLRRLHAGEGICKGIFPVIIEDAVSAAAFISFGMRGTSAEW